MSDATTPQLETRDAQQIAQDFLAQAPGYTPGWMAQQDDVGNALAQVFARYLQALGQRLNQAPDKNKLAFLDQLGISLLPAQSARAPVVFQMIANGKDSHVPAQFRLAANVPGLSQPLGFETEQDLGLAIGNLAGVVCYWPDFDSWADYTASAQAGQPFALFSALQPVPHALYLAHDTYFFALAGQSTVDITFQLATPGNQSMDIAWEYWDGGQWAAFNAFNDTDVQNPSLDGTQGLTRSGVVHLGMDCGQNVQTTVNGIEAFWVRGRLNQALSPDPTLDPALINRIRIGTIIDCKLTVRLNLRPPSLGAFPGPGFNGLRPDQAYADSLKLDVTKTFYPFGQQPRPGNAFYFAVDAVFSKPGAQVTLSIVTLPVSITTTGLQAPVLGWEYWDGSNWQTLTPNAPPQLPDIEGIGWVYWDGSNWQPYAPSGSVASFQGNELFTFTVPPTMSSVQVNNQEAFWVRVHLESGGYGKQSTIPFPSGDSITVTQVMPPAISDFRIFYLYTPLQDSPQQCQTYNDFQYVDHGMDVRWPGNSFAAYQPSTDTLPTLYLGFDQPLPADDISLYLDIQESDQTLGPLLVWEYWDGANWQVLTVQDETANLALPGMLSFVASGVDAPLPRFGVPMNWIRGRLRDDGDPVTSVVNGLYPNAVWASQLQTVTSETLGLSTGQPDQSFFFRQTPVLPGEVVQVQELDGARANVEYPLLLAEVLQQGLSAADVRTVTDSTGTIQEVWVTWTSVSDLLFSGPDDRHYVIQDRSQGQLVFGDNTNGKIPPVGSDNVLAWSYQAGGGQIGNVAVGAINQMQGAAAYVQGVSNPRAAEGGADSDTIVAAGVRGPKMQRNRRQAITATDYEELAIEASPAVAVARALPTTHPSGRPAPGWVKVILVPQSLDPQPQPSFDLRQEVLQFLADRAPAAIADQISVSGPTYLSVGVETTVTPVDPTEAGAVFQAVMLALQTFLHPLTGGPDGTGWPFGRDVYLSDVAALLESVPGVDYVSTLLLLLNGTPIGEVVPVPPDQMVAAGVLRVILQGGS